MGAPETQNYVVIRMPDHGLLLIFYRKFICTVNLSSALSSILFGPRWLKRNSDFG